MAKKTNKKAAKKNGKSQQIRKEEERTKLGPGKKQCRNCRQIIPIHKKICTECGHVHEMKKNKEDIMKCLSKVTPIVIKSVIQNNDFNQFKPWNQQIIFTVGPVQKDKQENAPATLSRNNSTNSRAKKNELQKKKSNVLTKSQSENQNKFIKKLNHNQFSCAIFKNPISCISSSRDWLIVVQTVQKTPLELQEKQIFTIKAYNLQNFNLVGVDYLGSSIIHFSYSPPSLQQAKNIRFSTINIKQYVRKVKVFANMLVILTGRSTLLVISLPNPQQSGETHQYSILNKIQIIQPSPDKITTFQFLRSSAKEDKSIFVAVGTLYGRITVYKINSEGHSIVRFIPNAHFQMVTAISQCSINQDQQINSIIFSSGSYDGSVKIWDLYENSPIFQHQCSNRKIWSIFWDPGAKYLIINRDEINDPCIIICFFSINKIEQCVNLSSTAQTRNIKTQKLVSMISHDYYSKNLAAFDSTNGTLKIISLEELRCNSLKKKKPKKDETLEKLYRVTWKEGEQKSIGSLPEIEELSDIDVQQKKWNKGELKKFPLFSGLCIQAKQNSQFIYLSTVNGEVIIMKNII